MPKGPREEVDFTSVDAARNFLTRERLALLRTIRRRRPDSLYELAKMVEGDFKNVHGDIAILERHRLVRITKEPRGKRKRVLRATGRKAIHSLISFWLRPCRAPPSRAMRHSSAVASSSRHLARKGREQGEQAWMKR